MSKSPKKIVLAVTGGIAAYKSCEIVRGLVKNKFDCQVMLTKSAQKFVTALTFEALSGKPVACSLFDDAQNSEIEHIRLADSADLIVIAPATADIIAKIAHGICDDLVSTVVCATKAPVLIAPSMNVNMYLNPITQENIKKLTKYGYYFVGPEEGELACGWEGQGRMSEATTIVERIKKILTP